MHSLSALVRVALSALLRVTSVVNSKHDFNVVFSLFSTDICYFIFNKFVYINCIMCFTDNGSLSQDSLQFFNVSSSLLPRG